MAHPTTAELAPGVNFILAVSGLLFPQKSDVCGENPAHPGGLPEFLQTDPQLANELENLFVQIKKAFTKDIQIELPENDEVISQPYLDEAILKFRSKAIEVYREKKQPLLVKLPWPQGLPFAIAITHDVDLTRKYGMKSFAGQLLRGKISRLIRETRQKSSYWTFPELLSLYAEKNWKSTFFFLARPWEKLHYRYDIRTEQFKKLFENIRESGHEIGLHTSRYAFDHPERIVREKKRLEEIAGGLITGVRQHYLRLKFPSAWQVFEDAGFEYDSSCGFNDFNGFRAGTSFPFRAMNAGAEKHRLYEIPFSIMDYPLTENKDLQADSIPEFLRRAETVMKTGGLLHFLWHQHNLVVPGFQECWMEITKWLSGRTFYQDSLRGLLDWWKNRNQVRLQEIREKESGHELLVSSKVALNDLVLKVYYHRRLHSADSNIDIEKVEAGRCRLRIRHLNKGLNRIKLDFGGN